MPAVWQYVGDDFEGDGFEVGDGVWEQVEFKRPYVKYSGVWTACRAYWQKVNGQWVQKWVYDTTPPGVPELQLILVEDFDTIDGKKTLKTRYIRVGVRMPAVNHDPDVPMIRVLTDYNDQAPTSPLGGTYTSAPDSNYPTEPWSDWRYGTLEEHHDNSKVIFKQWPRDATVGTQLKGDKNYHFGAWAVDANGNWSGSTINHIDIPKGGVDQPRTVVKEATFVPNAAGSWTKVGTVGGKGANKNNPIWGFKAGNLEQQLAPRSQGLWFYGGQFADNIKPGSTIKSCQINAYRLNDKGSGSAHLTIFWTPYGHSSALPGQGQNAVIVTNQDQNLGNINKGQNEWFNLPTQFYDNLKNGTMKGVGFSYHRPGAASGAANPDDYSVLAWNTGAIHIVWEENL